jgi:hypothetical protein
MNGQNTRQKIRAKIITLKTRVSGRPDILLNDISSIYRRRALDPRGTKMELVAR